jgi:hypothetical protein
MKTQVTHNTAQIRRRFESRAAAVASELRSENAQIAKELTDASKAILEAEVYAIPSDRPRSRRLIGADKWVAVGMSVVHRNKMHYFPYRLQYGKPGGRPAKPPKRASYWVSGAYRKRAGSIRARRRAAIMRAWKR